MSSITAIYTKLFSQISSSESHRFVPFFNSSTKFIEIGTFMGLQGTAFFLRFGHIRRFIILSFTEPLPLTPFRNTLTFSITNGFPNFRRNIWQTYFLGVVAGHLSKRFTYQFFTKGIEIRIFVFKKGFFI